MNNYLNFYEEYIVIDIETTGLSPYQNDIIEIAGLKILNGQVIETFQELINPGYPIDAFITNLTGITSEMVKSAPPITEIIDKFFLFIENYNLVGHNLRFDLGFLNYNLDKHFNKIINNKYADTMYISRRLFPEFRHHRLTDLISRFNFGNTVEHRAKGDAYQTMQCYEYLKSVAKVKQ